MPLLVCWNSTGKQFNPKTLYFKQNYALMWLSFDLVLVNVPLSIQKSLNGKKDKRSASRFYHLLHILHS